MFAEFFGVYVLIIPSCLPVMRRRKVANLMVCSLCVIAACRIEADTIKFILVYFRSLGILPDHINDLYSDM